MLRWWYETNSFVEEEAEEVDADEEVEPDLPSWGLTEEAEQQCEYEVSDHLTEEQKSSLQQLLAAFKDTLQNKRGRTQVTEHSLHTEGERPVRLRPYRLPYVYRRTVEKELNEMLKEGVISRSTSEWAAPVVLITKKNGELRFCVDYRRLNAISSMDSYPMPRADEMIDQLGRARFISTLDLSRGYWQVPMSVESRKKTAFITPYGLFEFNVMPFGLQGAPATFQRMMDQFLRGLEESASAYIDDVVVHSVTWDDHLVALKAVLGVLKEAGLTVKPAKCHFAMKECCYLGHVVGNGQVRPDSGPDYCS